MRTPPLGRKVLGKRNSDLSQSRGTCAGCEVTECGSRVFPLTQRPGRSPKSCINPIVRTPISVALLVVSASGAIAQRRGAFVPGPPYAGRPPVAAVAGTPGTGQWNPGSPGTQPCCFGSNRNGNWHGRLRNRDQTPQILAVPVPVVVGEADAQSANPEDPPLNQGAPEAPVPPITLAFPPATPPPIANGAGSSLAAEPPPKRCVAPTPPDPPHVLIALNDGWVYAAVAYWVDKDVLHYVTTHGDHNQVSLSLVDRKTSARLNRASQMALTLP